jgi:hypothetical protein
LSEKEGSISDKINMVKQSQPIDGRILGKIYDRGRGWAFTPNDFSAYGSRSAIDKSLSRLAGSGKVRRLSRGLYDYPQTHPVLGLLQPTPDAIAKALAGRRFSRIQPTGAYAANLLGLTTQVPARIVYLTDGPSFSANVGTQQIQLKNTTPKNMATAGRVSGLVIQALRFMGPKNVDGKVIQHLQRQLSDADKKQLLKDVRYAPAWIGAHMRAIAAENSGKQG